MKLALHVGLLTNVASPASAISLNRHLVKNISVALAMYKVDLICNVM